MSYNPRPPRVWSRVQNSCTFIDDNSYNSIFVPLTGKTGTLLAADYQKQMLQKGNVLQYKKNSSGLTKNQRYTQICKGMWTNRTKSYATQTQTYTNPNTSNLKQVNYISVPNNNSVYIPGPFNFNIQAPDGCNSNIIKEGGSLLCNTVVNPCTDEVIKQTKTVERYPTYCSDVPGPIQDLYWDSRLDTWYPRQRYIMPTSGTKWPEGYKGLVSAVDPESCKANFILNNTNSTNNNDNANSANLNSTNNNDNTNSTNQNSTNNHHHYHQNHHNHHHHNNADNDDNDNDYSYYVIKNTYNIDNSIHLSKYIKNNYTTVTIDNKTNKILKINSIYLIYNNSYYPDGTYNLELYPNYTITIYYFINHASNSQVTLKSIIF
jgi:hypothetical protein